MATGTPTPGVGLNQWQLADKIKMDEFNADNQSVDNAIGALRGEVAGKADRAELEAKANLTDLDAKADRTELDAKANLSDLEELASAISAEALESLTARVEALEAGSGGTPVTPGTPLGETPTGGIVKIGINGDLWDFLVVQHGRPSSDYDVSFDGGTILLMKDLYESRQWHSSNLNDYAKSTIHTYLNNTFLNLIDINVRSYIKQVKIPYRPGSGTSMSVNSGANGLTTSVWLPSMPEIGFSGLGYMATDGAVFSYFKGAADAKRVAYLNGTARYWWLRSPFTAGSNSAWLVAPTGSYVANGSTLTIGYDVRPVLTLPSTLLVSDTGEIVTG